MKEKDVANNVERAVVVLYISHEPHVHSVPSKNNQGAPFFSDSILLCSGSDLRTNLFHF